MIVELAQVKALLGIELDDETEDAHLTQLILAATVFVENETHVRFDTPTPKTEYQRGSGRLELFIRGHIDESSSESESADPGAALVVSERLVGDIGGTWEDLEENVDYERRGDTLLGPSTCGWGRHTEFRLVYNDGYLEAPEDIQQLLLEMVSRQYTIDFDLAAGTAGVTSESIGDYSYTVDLGAAASISGEALTATGWMTINHYKRILV